MAGHGNQDADYLNGRHLDLRTVTLTADELDALLQDLEGQHGEHDFEPECPACTGTRKLRAALNPSGVSPSVAQSTKGGQ
jgi:hypothetical protein